MKSIAVAVFVAMVVFGRAMGPAQAVVILNVDGSGELLGAQNLEIDSRLFTVEFLEGSCVGVFGGCDENSDFTFQNFASSQEAAFELLSQVFVDGTEGAFDTSPELTFGCESSLVCNAIIPFEAQTNGSVRTQLSINRSPGTLSDGASDFFLSTTNSTVGTNGDGQVFAKFTEQSALISPAPTVQPDVDVDGQLLGAENVFIDGATYDIVFFEGSCADIFEGCDDNSDFTFRNFFTSQEAALELLSQVFVDGTGGAFDTNPDLTFGCESSLICNAFIPFEVLSNGAVRGQLAINRTTGLTGDGTSDFFISTTESSAEFGNEGLVFVQFIKTSTVPEPSTLVIFGIGLIGIAGMRRRRKEVMGTQYLIN